MQAQITCVCGKQYWPKQAWIHDKCNQSVTTNMVRIEPVRDGPTVTVTICRDCVEKDGEIQRLRNQLEKLTPKPAKRDRAAYMREFRKRASP